MSIRVCKASGNPIFSTKGAAHSPVKVSLPIMQKTLLLLLVFLAPLVLSAQTIGPDPGFGDNGLVITGPYEGDAQYFGTYLSQQSDGSAICASHLLNQQIGAVMTNMIRVGNDGSIDAAFTAGTALLSNQATVALAVQPDDKVLISRSLTVNANDVVVLRLNKNGTLDSTFGVYGEAKLQREHGFWRNLFVQHDGKIVAYAVKGNHLDTMVIERLLPNGLPDPGFGNNGLLEFASGDNENYPFDCAEQADGKIIIAGMSTWKGLLIRLNPDGSLDQNFGTDGYVIDSLGLISEFYGMDLLPNGKIVTCGYRFFPKQALVAQYNSDGSRDMSFADHGIHYINEALQSRELKALPDGRLLVMSWTGNQTDTVSLTMLHPDGQRDTSFAPNGIYKILDASIYPRDMVVGGNAVTFSGRVTDASSPYYERLAVYRLRFENVVNTKSPVQPTWPLEVYPNPVKESFTAKLYLTENTPLSLYLYDMSGKRVHQFIENETYPAGEQEWQLTFPRALPAGTYVLCAESGGVTCGRIRLNKL